VESPRAYFLLWFEIDGLNIVFFAERNHIQFKFLEFEIYNLEKKVNLTL